MFEYRKYEERFCKAQINAADTLRHWAMFTEQSEKGMDDISEKDYDKMIRAMERDWNAPVKKKT